MVICAVVGCSKRSDRDKDVSFYRIPKIRTGRGKQELELTTKRRTGFVAALSREDLTSSGLDQARICSRHFICGRPASLYDELNPDWLPTQNLGHNKRNESVLSTERYTRRKARLARAQVSAATALLQTDGGSEEQPENSGLITATHGGCGGHLEGGECNAQNQSAQGTEETADLHSELNNAYETIHRLQDKINRLQPFTQVSMKDKPDDFILHYTGIPNYRILNVIFDFVSSKITPTNTKLTPFQEFMVVLMKLRLHPSSKDLAYRFDVHPSTISRVMLKWLTVMDIRLKPLVMWPEREGVRKTMPDCFRAKFGEKVVVVIDCFEIFIERPCNLLARACTWSTYKHHNTVKLLIGIAPQGVVTFISEAWGGRVSDKYITEHCGILDKLLPGDVVLADRGFDISDSVGMQQAHLHIPAFTKGKNQLSALEVEQTRSIANVRIHVERVIGCVRQKFSLLKGTLPIDLVIRRAGEECPLIDRIARVCCALYNMCNSVVPFD